MAPAEQKQWSDFPVAKKPLNLPKRFTEPFRIKKYKACHKIVNFDWKMKKPEDLEKPLTQCDDLALYSFSDKKPHEGLMFEKQETDRFD